MKKENQLWIDYIFESFGQEILDRVELIARNMIVEHTHLFFTHLEAFEGRGDQLGYIGGKQKTPEQIWQSILDSMKEMENKRASDEVILHNFIFDEFLGQVFENYYNQLSAEKAVSVCKEILSNQRVRDLYKMRPTKAENADVDR